MGRMTVAAGPLVAAAAWALGAPWPMAVAGLAVWTMAWIPGWIGRAAPPIALLLMASAAPSATLLSWSALLWLGLASAALAAWLLPMRSGMPLRGVWVLPVTALLLAPLPFTLWAPTFLASDVATRSQVLLLAVALAIATLLVRARAQSRPSPW